MYEQMLTEVRTLNARLPLAHHVRILLGDPPIDWSTVTSPADEDMNDWRDAHVAHVIEREVMSRGHTALILFGGAHLGRAVVFPNSLIHLLEAKFPGRTWVTGVLDAGRVDPDVRSRLAGWPVPAGLPVRGTWLATLRAQQIGFNLSAGRVEDDVDALILLTAGAPRPQSPIALDATYALELARRRRLADATLPFRGAKIRFEDGRVAFAADAHTEDALHTVRRELLRDRELTLVAKAFADRTEADALQLSAKRAELVVEWLASRGVDRTRLLARGCGATRPLTFGKTADDRAMNRRAELVRITPTARCEPPW